MILIYFGCFWLLTYGCLHSLFSRLILLNELLFILILGIYRDGLTARGGDCLFCYSGILRSCTRNHNLSCSDAGFLINFLGVSFILFILFTVRYKGIIAGYLLFFGGLTWFCRNYLLWSSGYLDSRRIRGLLVSDMRWRADYHDLLYCQLERLMVLLLQ